MNSISNTAFYCCGVRMEDAERPFSMCSDTYAKRFMDARGRQIFEPFRSEKMPNISNIARCRIIDELLTDAIRTHAEVRIISVGAGFDTRPYRLQGGEWVEIDEAQIIEFKNEQLPIEECQNSLRRLSIDFSSESLGDRLMELDEPRPTVIVIEGVFMYLQDDAINSTLSDLQRVFPQHQLICDLMTRNFFEKFARRIHAKLVEAGGEFTDRSDHPEQLFLQRDYQQIEHIPNFRRAAELGALWKLAGIPGFVASLLLKVFMKDLNGYGVYCYRYGE